MTVITHPLPADQYPVFTAIQSPSRARWALSLVLISSLHLSVFGAIFYYKTTPVVTTTAPATAMMLDLLPITKATPISVKTPGLKQQLSPQPKSKQQPVVKNTIKTQVIKQTKAVIPKKTRSQKQHYKKPPKAQPQQTALGSSATKTAAPIKKPQYSTIIPPGVKASWQSALLAHLEQHKRYPRKARRKKQEGTVFIRLTIDHNGNVLNYQLKQASNYEALNNETQALVKRAQPLPKPPLGLVKTPTVIVVPVIFTLR